MEIHRHLEGLPRPLPLARFTVADLWVSFCNTQQVRGRRWASSTRPLRLARAPCCLMLPHALPSVAPQGSMFISVCIPRVEARDLRPEVPLEQALVISSGHKASFLMLEVRWGRCWWAPHTVAPQNQQHWLHPPPRPLCAAAVRRLGRHGRPGPRGDNAKAAPGGRAVLPGCPHQVCGAVVCVREEQPAAVRHTRRGAGR